MAAKNRQTAVQPPRKTVNVDNGAKNGNGNQITGTNTKKEEQDQDAVELKPLTDQAEIVKAPKPPPPPSTISVNESRYDHKGIYLS